MYVRRIIPPSSAQPGCAPSQQAVFEELDGAELRLHPLPRPTDAEVETLAVTVARSS
ncbi:MAG TPA: hypothetical protein VMT11_13250 [Myxococcaceae bacterium]|nr:hypothetical protein [Myxococcaceae bacterium]